MFSTQVRIGIGPKIHDLYFGRNPLDTLTHSSSCCFSLEMAAHLVLYQNGFSPPYIGLNQLNGTSANARLTSSTATFIPRDTYSSIMISTVMIGYT